MITEVMYVRVSKVDLVCTTVLLIVLTSLLLHMRANLDKLSGLKNESDMLITDINDTTMVPQVEVRSKQIINRKSILIYSTLFDLKHWPSLSLKEIKTFMESCEYKHCSITYDKDAISNADAVLFHGVDVLHRKEFAPDILRDVAKKKKVGQKWVFFIQESPDNYDGFDRYAHLFDWLMSYKYTSDILVPYGHYKPLDEGDIPPDDNIDYAADKNKVGIWFASNCGRPRDKFMQELRRYIPISVGGKCAQRLFNESVKCDRGSAECHAFIKSHKFFFALENCFCDYYVSEKYWQRGIDWGMVPVVMGARYDKLNVIPGSYIDAMKFKSIKDLANYLKFLDSNNEEYNKYFHWKKKYKRVGFEKMCELCKALHENKYSRPYKRIWSADLDCKPFQWKVDLLNKLVRESRSKITPT